MKGRPVKGHLFSMTYGDSESASGAIVAQIVPRNMEFIPVLPLFPGLTNG